MIQLFVECGDGVPFAFHHDAVTGVRVHCQGRIFQILEGPEAAVMLAVAVLANDAAHLARTAIRTRAFSDWRQETFSVTELPVELAEPLSAFAAATASAAGPDAHRAIGFLSGLVETHPVPAITSGRRPISKVGGAAGNRAWMMV